MSTALHAVSFLAALVLQAADPPTVDALDFDSMPIAALNRENVELVLTALDGKAPDRAAVEKAWWMFHDVQGVDLATIVRLADSAWAKKSLDEACREHLCRPATSVERLQWFASGRTAADGRLASCRMRRIAASRGRKLEGVAVDMDDKPVAGAAVRDIYAHLTSSTDASGRFSLEPYSPFDSFPYAYAETDDLVARCNPLPLKGSIAFRMRRRKPISVVVNDPEGRPLRNAVVFVYGVEGDPNARVEHPVFWHDLAVTDQNGRATLNGMTADDHPIQFVARHPRFFEAATKEEVRRKTTPSVLSMRPGAEIRGKIVGPEDQPLVGAAVYWTPKGAERASRVHATDSKGNFSFVDHPGAGVLVASHPECAMTAREILIEGGAAQDLVLKLSEGEYIEGKVNLEGRPVAFTEVSVGAAESLPGFTGDCRVCRTSQATATDAEGAFRIGPLPKGGRFKVIGWQEDQKLGYESETVEAGAKNVEIKVRPNGL